MALSGLALLAFLLVHLGGNLTLFVPGGGLFNSYAHHLESVGPLLYVAEFILAAIFIGHVSLAIGIQLGKREARPDRYAVTASKGGPSKQTAASKSMIYTGLVLLVFIPVHIWMFKFNYGHGHGMVEQHGTQVKDLFATVVKEFQKPAIVWSYVAVMLFLGFHLRHGFWSALQSLGALRPKYSGLVYAAGLAFAVLMAGGFLILPLYVHFFVKAAGVTP